MEPADLTVFCTVLTAAIGTPQEPSIPPITNNAPNFRSPFITASFTILPPSSRKPFPALR